MNNKIVLYLITFFATIFIGQAVSGESDNLAANIEKAIAFNAPNFDSLSEVIFQQVEDELTGAFETILPFFETPGLDNTKLAFLIVLLGATKSSEAVDTICTMAEENNSKEIVGACLNALTKIDREPAATCLMKLLDNIIDHDNRYGVFDALAEIKYEPALDKSLEILQADAETEYWKPIFFYGKMGDSAIPYLLSKVNDDDLNTRYNAINLLGQWLISPDASATLEKRFWVEDDKPIQNLILSSIEQINYNPDSITAFMKQVQDKSKNDESKKFAKEAIQIYDNLGKYRKQALELKDGSPEEFQEVYKKLWDSYGREGDYDRLMAASKKGDEEALKKLKERILFRNSDEAFYDYKKINNILSMNRLIYN